MQPDRSVEWTELMFVGQNCMRTSQCLQFSLMLAIWPVCGLKAQIPEFALVWSKVARSIDLSAEWRSQALF